MKATISAAGFRTRFFPATKAKPKEMLPVYDNPIIQYVVKEAISWIDDKSSIEYALDDDEFKNDLASYMESYI